MKKVNFLFCPSEDGDPLYGEASCVQVIDPKEGATVLMGNSLEESTHAHTRAHGRTSVFVSNQTKERGF